MLVIYEHLNNRSWGQTIYLIKEDFLPNHFPVVMSGPSHLKPFSSGCGQPPYLFSPLRLPSHPPKSYTPKGAEIINFCQIGNIIDWLFGASVQSFKSLGKIVYQINTWEHLCSDGKTFNLMNSPFTGGSSFINILIRFLSWIYLFFF